MSRLLIRGGRVLDPACDRDGAGDVLIEDGVIVAVDADIDTRGAEVLDAEGGWIAPGFVDLHTHLREPGQEYKEDIASGGCAAVAGGFTSIACMANTQPVNDDPSVTEYILERARQESPARVLPIAAATRGLEGKVMTEFEALVRSGAVAFSDDGKTIMDSGVMRRVFEYSRLVKRPVIVHAEDRTLVGDGVVNEGPVSTRLGLPGNPVATMVMFYQLVQPTLRHLAGESECLPLEIQAVCQSSLRKRPGRMEFQRGVLSHGRNGELLVHKTGMQGSGIISSIAQADFFIVLDDEDDTIEPGMTVKVQPFFGLM